MSKRQPYLSVCIPTYEMRGLGPRYLKESLKKLVQQTVKDFEVVISDYAEDASIKQVCDSFKHQLNIRYFRNPHRRFSPIERMSANTNHVLSLGRGKILKLLFQDDFLFDNHALEQTLAAFDLTDDAWLVSACEHSHDGHTYIRPFYPRYNENILWGINTIGCPSVLTLKRTAVMEFDTHLNWLMDCDYYYRLFKKYGHPKILSQITVVNRLGAHQISHNEVNKDLKKREYQYMMKKYGHELSWQQKLKYILTRFSI